MQHTKFLALALTAVLFVSSCKKEDSLATNLTPTTGNIATAADLVKDTALLATRDLYLWYDKIPTTFNPRSYADPAALMTAVRQYSIEPGFSAAVDRWSFAATQQQWNDVSSGVAGDFGLNVFFRQEGDLRVRAVEAASPAGRAGVRRGWRITGINGNGNITTSNSSFIVQGVYQSSASSFAFQKPDGSTVNLSLNASTYQENPLVLDSVYAVNGRNVGYLAFNSFLGDTTAVQNGFSRVFNRFAAQGIQDLVVDLRYNGGGYVNLAQTLADYLAPSSANGQVMMTQKFNANYSSYNSTDRFQKRGSLNLNRVFFIVSSGTASASELLINSLKPYMDVLLVGPSKTHGKPVGYFPVPVGGWYVFPVSFATVNKNGEGAYYDGLALNGQAADGLDKDWGDLLETALAAAVRYITTGVFRTSAGQTPFVEESPAVKAGNQALDQSMFKGAVDTRGMR